MKIEFEIPVKVKRDVAKRLFFLISIFISLPTAMWQLGKFTASRNIILHYEPNGNLKQYIVTTLVSGLVSTFVCLLFGVLLYIFLKACRNYVLYNKFDQEYDHKEWLEKKQQSIKKYGGKGKWGSEG